MGLSASMFEELDAVSDWGLLATDEQLNITGWNRWLEQKSGLADDQVLNRSLFEVFPELLTRHFDRYYRQALSGQTVLLSQKLHRYILPLPRNFQDSANDRMHQAGRIIPLANQGSIRGTLTLLEDVTERVEAEVALQSLARQQTALATLARSALSGSEVRELAIAIDAHLREHVNSDYTEILIFEQDRWIPLAGSGWKTTPELDDAPRRQAAFSSSPSISVGAMADRFLNKHEVMSSLVVPITIRDSNTAGMIGVYARAMRPIPQDEVQFVQALADILGVATERHRLEVELRSRADQLADAAQRKDEFLAMLAHELRNPLAPIRNGLQALLNHDIPTADAQRLMGMMSRQVSQMASLIDDLLDVSRITRGKVTLRKETVELTKIIAQSIDIVQPLIDARGHNLRTHLPTTSLSIHVDGTRMVQILGNLLNNAAKYTDAGGQIDLIATREEDDVVIRIRDTGIGISAEMLPRVFDLFSQVDTTLHRSEGGLGIGLTLVRSLVELHAGSVTVTSPGTGHGSEFSVRIPIGSVETPPAVVRSVESPTDHSPRRILIVDDNVDAAESLAMLLSLYKHHVWTAFEGSTALELATSHNPELILLDIGLPKMDGYEVARRIRGANIKPNLLIAMTGYGQEEDRRKSNEAGFDKHIVKPVDPQLLIQLVNALPSQSIDKQGL